MHKCRKEKINDNMCVPGPAFPQTVFNIEISLRQTVKAKNKSKVISSSIAGDFLKQWFLTRVFTPWGNFGNLGDNLY